MKIRWLAIAVLLIAQLSVTLHAHEHGVGQHAHDGIPCLYGATNDDDVLAPPPSLTLFQADSRATGLNTAASVSLLPAIVVGLPPATGPPISS